MAGAVLSVQSFLPYQPLVTYSASSGQEAPSGALTYVDPDADWVLGDVIAFHVTDAAGRSHIYLRRLAGFDAQSRTITTMGATNDVPDVWLQPVLETAVIGKAKWTVHYLGYLALWLSTLRGLVAFLSLFAELLFGPALWRWAMKPIPARPRYAPRHSPPVLTKL
jgi:hypothetical protein